MTNTRHTILYRPLKIMFWNANGVLNDQYLFPGFLAEGRIDIELINEIHLHPTKNWNIPSYIIYRTEGHRPPNGKQR
jgi:hypothetical protein